MKQINIIAILILLLTSLSLYASDYADEHKFKISLSYEREQASSWYSHDGKDVISEITDPNAVLDIDSSKVDEEKKVVYDTTFRNYLPTVLRNTIKLDFEWKPFDNLYLKAEIPLSFYKETERFDQYAYHDYTTNRPYYTGGEERAEFTLTRIDYIGLSFRSFILNSSRFKVGALGEVHIPTGTDDYSRGNPDYPFLSDGWFEASAGVITGVSSKTTRLMAEFIYNYRAEEFSDRFLINTMVGFSSVKNTEIQMLVYYGYCFEEFTPDYIFLPRDEVLWANYLDVGLNFEFKFMEQFIFTGGYRISIWGENGWNNGIFNTKISYEF